jgi:hypothetical protein
MIVCTECGNAAPSVDGFCSSCGTLLEWSGERVAEAVPSSGPPPGPGWAPPPVWSPPPASSPPVWSSLPVGVLPDAEAVRHAPVAYEQGPRYDGLYCTTCGTQNLAGRTYCRYCGAPLDLSVAAMKRPHWWRRLWNWLFRRRPKAARAAGARPKDFGRRERTGTGAKPGTKGRRRARLKISKVAPLLIVLGLLGIGLGPGRYWITTHFSQLIGDAKKHVDHKTVEIVPIRALASSSRPGHGAALIIYKPKTTAWESAGGHDGVGQVITIVFAGPQDVSTIGIDNGLPGAGNTKAARVEAMQVRSNGKVIGTLNFAESGDFQQRSLPATQVTRLRLVITKTYRGQQTRNVAISRLQFERDT